MYKKSKTSKYENIPEDIKNTIILNNFSNPTSTGINCEWKPSTFDTPCYLQIDSDLKLLEGKVLSKRMDFWNALSKTASNEE